MLHKSPKCTHELSLVKVDDFHKKDDEDPYKWIECFEAAAKTNRCTNDRKIEITTRYVRNAIYDWYKLTGNTLNL